jgi:hypothetical protein
MIAIEKHELKVRKEQEKANEENKNFLRDQEMQEDTMEQQVPTPCRSPSSIGLEKISMFYKSIHQRRYHWRPSCRLCPARKRHF